MRARAWLVVVPALAAGAVLLLATRQRSERPVAPQAVAPVGERTGVDPTLARAGETSIRRAQEGGAASEAPAPTPVASGTVTIVDFDTARAEAGLACRVTSAGATRLIETDGEGRIHLAAGEHRLRAAQGDVVLHPERVRLAEGGAEVVTSYRARTLVVRVVDAQSLAPLARAHVCAESSVALDAHMLRSVFGVAQTTTDDHGEARLERVLAASAGVLDVSCDGYLPVARTLAFEDLDSPIDVMLERASREDTRPLRFIGIDGRPIAGVVVRAIGEPFEDAWTDREQLPSCGVSGADGRVVLAGWHARAQAWLCESPRWPMYVVPAEDAENEQVVVVPERIAGTLELRGVPGDRRPDRAVVSAYAPARSSSGASADSVVRDVALDGGLEIAIDVPRDTAVTVVTTLSDGSRASIEVIADAPGWRAVVDFAQSPPDGILELVAVGSRFDRLSVWSDAGGAYEVLAPAGGAERLEVPRTRASGGIHAIDVRGAGVYARPERRDREIPPREVLEIEFPTLHRFEVRVVEKDGEAVGGSVVTLTALTAMRLPGGSASVPEGTGAAFRVHLDPTWEWSTIAMNSFSARTSADGVAGFALPAGRYRVTVATPPWRSPLRDSLPLRGPSTLDVEGEGSATIVAERVRDLRVDVSHLERAGRLGRHWSVGEPPHPAFAREGRHAAFTIPVSARKIVLYDPEGAEVAELDLTPGADPVHWTPTAPPPRGGG